MPHILLYMTKWALLYIGLLLGIAALWPWDLPTYVGNLAATNVVTTPDWYFLWVFKLVDFQGVTPVIAVGATTLLLLYVLFVPFLDRSRKTHPRDRPFFLFIMNFLIGFFILMTVWGGLTPGISIVPMEVLERLGPLVVVNGLVVWLFYRRYSRSYAARLATQQGHRLPGVYSFPSAATRPTTTGAPEVRSHDG